MSAFLSVILHIHQPDFRVDLKTRTHMVRPDIYIGENIILAESPCIYELVLIAPARGVPFFYHTPSTKSQSSRIILLEPQRK